MMRIKLAFFKIIMPLEESSKLLAELGAVKGVLVPFLSEDNSYLRLCPKDMYRGTALRCCRGLTQVYGVYPLVLESAERLPTGLIVGKRRLL